MALSGQLGKGLLGGFVLGGPPNPANLPREVFGPVRIVSVEQPLTPLIVVEQ